MQGDKRIVLALRPMPRRRALDFATLFGSRVRAILVGESLIQAYGPSIVRQISDASPRRVPMCVHAAIHASSDEAAEEAVAVRAMGANMMTAHASGGAEMIEAVVKEGSVTSPAMEVIGITIATTFGADDFAKVYGTQVSIEEKAAQLAVLAASAGARGVTCSPGEVEAVRQALGEKHSAVKIYCLGIVLPGAPDKRPHKRSSTAEEAIARGADRVIVGRGVTEAPDPEAVFKTLEQAVA